MPRVLSVVGAVVAAFFLGRVTTVPPAGNPELTGVTMVRVGDPGDAWDHPVVHLGVVRVVPDGVSTDGGGGVGMDPAAGGYCELVGTRADGRRVTWYAVAVTPPPAR